MTCSDLRTILHGDEKCFSNGTTAVEKNKKFILNNKTGRAICKVRVDSCIITDNAIKKCDYLFSIEEPSKYYLVELKGVDLDTAVKQIESTFDYLNKDIKAPASAYKGVVVSSAVPRASTLKFQNLVDKLYRNKKLLITRKSGVYEERV